MNTQAIKNDLISWINSLNDPEVLRSLLLFKKGVGDVDWSGELSPEQRASIERGLADIQAGRTMTSREFWAKRGR